MGMSTLWLEGFLKKGIDYCDDFAAGWNQHRCEVKLEDVRKTQHENHTFLACTGQIASATNGLVDGWLSRQKFCQQKQE